jgi:hypothetical protein
MNLRKFWRPKLGEWVFGSAVALGSIAPSVALSGLLGGTVGGTACNSSLNQWCVKPTGTPPPLCNAPMGVCMSSTTGTGTVIPGTGGACPAGCVPPAGYVLGNCSVGNNCYY